MNAEGGVPRLTEVIYLQFEHSARAFRNLTPAPAPLNIACEGSLFLTTGRWGTSPTWGNPPPCEQALISVDLRDALDVEQVIFNIFINL